MGADRDGFTSFVAASEAALRCTAHLLTGDPGSAEDLLQTALARARRRWRRVRQAEDPLGVVRQFLVDAHLGRRRRPWHGEQVLVTLPDPAPGEWQEADARGEAVRRVLDRMSPRARAALVLRVAEDLPESETARVLRCPSGTVRTDVVAGLAAVRAVLPPGGTPPGGDDLDVRDALRRLAAAAGPVWGADTAGAAVALARRQRRTWAGWAVGALAAALLVTTVPAMVPAADPAADPAAAPTAGGTTGREEPAGPALDRLPPRGSLAGDEEFLAGAAALSWSAPPGVDVVEFDPPEATRRVLFAGDLPGDRRWALVAGQDRGGGVTAWFGGPAGAASADLTLLAPPERSSRRTEIALLDTAGAVPVLVVVGLPGDGARYSPGTVRSDDGVVGHAWTDLPEVDGVLVATVGGPVYPGAEVVEIVRAGLPVATLEYLLRTDASATTVDWPFTAPLDPSLGTDGAARERFLGCLPEGFAVTFSGDGAVTTTYPTVGGRRSDVELAMLYAEWEATLTECSARALAGG